MSGPSPYSIEMAMSVVEATLSRLRDTGELDIETDEDALLAMLGEEAAEVGRLLERIIAAALEAEANAEAAARRASELTDRKRRFARLAETWRGTALAMMDALNMRQHKSGELTVSLMGGVASAVVTDEAALPEEYFVITRVPSIKAIRADLAEGVVIPGAELSNGPPRLMIRTK